MRKRLSKIIRYASISLLVLLVALYVVFVRFSAPPSDKALMKLFQNSPTPLTITKWHFKDFSFRVLKTALNPAKPTLVFVHGTIGSCANFEAYMNDSTLTEHFNMLSYDRIGYNYNDPHSVQESIAFERDMLHSILDQLPNDNTILVGYSYGGPIALATRKKLKKVVLLAPAVYSAVEPMPWMVNLYRWPMTRWMIPKVWQEASKEKLSHRSDLQNFEKTWAATPNQVISMHGNSDWIVPLENSTYLQKQLPSSRFQLIPLHDAGHDLVWSRFEPIKQQLLKLKD